MSEEHQCPLCHRQHEVASDGTIPTWVVIWSGSEKPTRRYLSRPRHERLLALREKYGRLNQEQEEQYPKGFISNRSTCFIHYEDAISEYRWIRGILVKRGDWEAQQAYLTLKDGERLLWHDLFEEPGIYNWMA